MKPSHRSPDGLTKADKKAMRPQNLLRRDFTARRPDEKWLTDITQIPCKDGKLYIAPVFDCFGGEIVSLAMDINMRSMANRGMRNGRTVNDIGFGMFRTMLAYKLERRLGKLVTADRFYPSSQLCSACGFRNIAVKDLSVREWTCPECGAFHDRDVNAAVNLRNYYTAATEEIEARGENVRPQDVNLNGSLAEPGKIAG